MKKTTLKLMMAGLVLLTTAAGGFAEEMAGQGEMSPEQKEMMARMEAYSTVNENHALLATLAGSWKATIEHKMSADAPAETSEGTSQNVMVFGGRFLEQVYQGEFGGNPFEGKGIMGYDNIQKRFQGIWYDSMATGIMVSVSTYDSAKKVFSEEGQLSCPLTNGQRSFRGVTTLIDADHYTYEMFMKDESGNEFRAMRIDYARVK